MNILYLTISPRRNHKTVKGIIDEFLAHGHSVYVVCPYDIDDIQVPDFKLIDGAYYLFVKSGYPTGKISLVKKVKNFITLDSAFQKAIREAVKTISIDMVLYSTPPITLVNTIKWVKQKYKASSYLMLKDIFPQNAVDLGMLKTHGLMGIPYKFFRRKEKKLYEVSDYIGCMSEANVKYVIDHNPEIEKNRVGICVNSYKCKELQQIATADVRKQYDIPDDKIVFVYGGNLGKPQGLSFLVDILKSNKEKTDRYFVICGGGNDQDTILHYIKDYTPSNVIFISTLKSDDFDTLMQACDVGMLFLDRRFTIPNFPSRLLSIIQNEKPALAATDVNTDIGEVIMNNGFGWWCESGDLIKFNQYLDEICTNPAIIKEKGKIGRVFFEQNYTSTNAYEQIINGYNISKTIK